MIASLKGEELFVQDCYGGADPQFRLPVRVITELAWHSLFARNLLIPAREAGAPHGPAQPFTIIDAPSFKADPRATARART